MPAPHHTLPIANHRTRIWDLPTRLFHWLLACAVVALVVTAKLGGNAMDWHLRLGHAVLALLIFRILWGVLGGHWSRFLRFVPTPNALLRYARGQSSPAELAGHSPLGALSVFAMLAVLIAQVASGLVSDDAIAFSGPLSRFVSGDQAAWATDYHAHWGQYLLYVLLGLHLVAVLFYSLRGRGVVRAMVTGDKHLQDLVPASRDSVFTRCLAGVLALVSAGIAWWIYQLGSIF